MRQGSTGQPGSSFELDTFRVCAIMGALLIAAGVIEALFELDDGGDYAIWYALEDLASVSAVGVLVLLASLRLGDAPWGATLRRVAPAIGVAVVVASVAIMLKDVSDDIGEMPWTPLSDLFSYVPITLGAAVFLSAMPRGDRVLGMPAEWARILAVVAFVIGIALAIDDYTDASFNKFWVFLDTFAYLSGLALFLLAISMEPAGNLRQSQGGGFNVSEMLNDSRLPEWIAFGGVLVIIAGIMMGFKQLDAPSDGIWNALQYWGYYLGLGMVVLLASGARLPGFDLSDPRLRYVLVGALVLMFIAGVKFAADWDSFSDKVWEFFAQAIDYPGILALAYVMYEAAQRPLRVVR
jgi:hypothetical protein